MKKFINIALIISLCLNVVLGYLYIQSSKLETVDENLLSLRQEMVSLEMISLEENDNSYVLTYSLSLTDSGKELIDLEIFNMNDINIDTLVLFEDETFETAITFNEDGSVDSIASFDEHVAFSSVDDVTIGNESIELQSTLSKDDLSSDDNEALHTFINNQSTTLSFHSFVTQNGKEIGEYVTTFI